MAISIRNPRVERLVRDRAFIEAVAVPAATPSPR
jgi:hypothetical protein